MSEIIERFKHDDMRYFSVQMVRDDGSARAEAIKPALHLRELNSFYAWVDQEFILK